eukprot:COSAG04_NODE_29547_length_268_cov_0.680473_1_plen_79_part_01
MAGGGAAAAAERGGGRNLRTAIAPDHIGGAVWRDEMSAAALALLVAVLAALCPAALPQGAQMDGGRPPSAVEQQLCHIG